MTPPPSATGQQLPPKENAIFKRVVKCYEQKQYRNGLKFAKQILLNPKFSEHGETLAMKGLILNCLGKKDEAYEFVKRGLKNDVRSHVCWHVYGLIQRADKKYDEAIKAYRNALKIDKENIQILRDLSLLQLQMRDLDGYRETRYQLFTLRPTQRASWIGFAMAYHLLKDYDMALKVLEEFRKTQTIKSYDYEHSEFLLYENMVFYEAGKYQEAFQHLESHRSQIFDYISYLETKGILLQKLHRNREAADVYRLLIEQNPENESYYRSLEQCLGLADPSTELCAERRLAFYDEMVQTFCRSLAPRRLCLSIVSAGEKFVDRIEPILIRMLRKGVAPLFTILRSLYTDREKVVIIEELLLTYMADLEKCGKFSKENVREPPSTLLWVYYFLSLHYDHLGDFSTALAFINRSIEHTPTLIELYMVKARIFKHAGNRFEAVRWMEEAQSLDTADRYINSKCAKYMLMAGMITEAEFMCSKFTREGIQASENLNEMQCMWFQTACAYAYRRRGQLGEALKKCHEVDRHFTDIIEDQFDFHTYCVRRMTLRAYVRLLRLEDLLRRHSFYFKAAKCAVKIYLRLHDVPYDDSTRTDGNAQSDTSSRELRKQFRKQKKLAVKAELERQKHARAPVPNQKHRQDVDPDEIQHTPLDPLVLVKTDKPLEEAVHFLKPLIQLNCDKVDAYTLSFEVYYRQKKVLLMLSCIRKAEKLDPTYPKLHLCKVKFIKFVFEQKLPDVVSDTLKETGSDLVGVSSLVQYNDEFLDRNRNSIEHRLAAAQAMCLLDTNRQKEAVELVTSFDVDQKCVTWKACRRVLKSLKSGELGPCDNGVIAAYLHQCRMRFPFCSAFFDQSELLKSQSMAAPSPVAPLPVTFDQRHVTEAMRDGVPVVPPAVDSVADELLYLGV